jgi:hypothetical protein
MTEIELLIKQTKESYDWTNKLIKSIPYEKWDTTPDILETNITWQVGHLLMSHYFYTMMVIVGHQIEVLQKIPIKEYDKIFTDGPPKNAVGKINPSEILNQSTFVQEKSIDILKNLTIADLNNKLEPTPTPHPFVKTKFEALDWNNKHTLYHCGQIGILKRVTDQRYDFGLRRA